MTRLAVLAALVAAQLACISVGDPLTIDVETWWLEAVDVSGDCELPPELAGAAWGYQEEEYDVVGRRTWRPDALAPSTAPFLRCDVGLEACAPMTFARETDLLHATVVTPGRGAAFDADLDLLGTCGPSCGVPGPDTAIETCAGAATLRFDRVIGGVVRQARPYGDQCAVLSTPLPARGEPTVLYVFNASSSQVSVDWVFDGGTSTIVTLSGGAAARVDTWVGDRFQILDNEDGTCLRAFDASLDLPKVVLDARGGR